MPHRVPGGRSALVDPKQEQRETLRELALAFFRDGVTPEERASLMHPHYVQHNPSFKRFADINGLSGKEGFLAYLKVLRAGQPTAPPQGPAGDPTYRIFVDGDYVVVLQLRKPPDPQNPGKTYESFWFDAWRVKDGRLYEHWDPSTIPEPVPAALRAPQPK
ncbi:MAG: nuclear transport factor 2 family protein [Steroidobacteraceae bacterium]|jgi:predicted SnoaL-like aldol condensation-catalyzing enzyme